MKLSFSTRGWPGLSFEDMLGTATDMGFSGVEIYNLQSFNALTAKGGPFHPHTIPLQPRATFGKEGSRFPASIRPAIFLSARRA